MSLNSWPPGTESTVRHNVLAEYIQDTAAKTGVNEIVQFNTAVEDVSKEGNYWKVRTSILEAEKHEKITKEWVSTTGMYQKDSQLTHSRNSMQ